MTVCVLVFFIRLGQKPSVERLLRKVVLFGVAIHTNERLSPE